MSSSPSNSIDIHGKGEKTAYVEESGDLEESQHGHVSSSLYLTVAWVACASFCYGFSGACIGGALVQTSFAVYFTELAQLPLITGSVSLYHAGGFFGVMSSSYISDRWGRRIVFLYATFFYVIGGVLMSAAQNLNMLVIGRLFIGTGAYCFLFGGQTYVVELSPATSRGLLGSTVGISLEMGYIVAGWLSYGLSFWLGTNMSWRLPFILQLVPIIPLMAGYAFIPESPRWLVQQGRGAEALKVLTKLHASPKDPTGHFSRAEHRQIETQYQLDKTLPSSWISMFTTYRRRTFTAILIMFGFLLAGDYFLATYGPQLFTAFGFSTQKSLLYQAAWLSLLLLNLLVMPAIDKFGRKVFLVVGVAGEGICLIILMLLSKYFGDGLNPAGSQAFVAMFLIYMLPLCITEPPAYLMSCEIFPLHIRTKGTAIAYATLAITNTWTLEAAATLVQKLQWKAYLLFICITAANVTAYIIFLPETKNVPLEEMARLFGEEDQVAAKDENSNY